MSYKYKITIFTPTYNRAYILGQLYRSIQKQTFRDFEWLIVDDGSTDNTEYLVNEWQKDANDFPIRYYKKDNGGKYRAINYALELAQGELFFTMDSDDYLSENALRRIAYWENTINNKHDYAGVAGNCGTSLYDSPNTPLGKEYKDTTALARYSDNPKEVIDGERAFAWYTDIHRKYLYPEFEGEKFMTEAVTWNRMARDGYKIRFFDEIIWIYEYRNDGLTFNSNDNFLLNPRGYALWQKEKAEFMHKPFRDKTKMWYNFFCEHTYCDEKYKLTKRQISEYMGFPLIFCFNFSVMNGFKNLLKGFNVYESN